MKSDESEQPIDSELFRLTMQVVADMHAHASNYLNKPGHKYVPRRDKTSVTSFDSGWPNVGPKETDESSIAHGKLFRLSDVPNLKDLESMMDLNEYARTRPNIVDRLMPDDMRARLGHERAELWYDIEVTSLPLSIYDRACALGLALGSQEVSDLYIQRERHWLADELGQQIVVPLLLTDIDLEADELTIDRRTRIERLSKDDLRAMDRDYDISGVPGPLATAAKYAVVIDTSPMPNVGPCRFVFQAEPEPDTSAVDVVCDALRIVSSAETGWARVFRRPLGWAHLWTDDLPNLQHVYTGRRYPPWFDDFGWLKEDQPITHAEISQVPAVVRALTGANQQTALATRRLSAAMIRDSADDAVVDACIGIEALLGQKGSELSFRIAIRAAVLLATKEDESVNPHFVYKMARKVYERRSELVHGSASAKHAMFQPIATEPAMHTSSAAMWLLREVLHERLLRPGWTREDLDELVLDGITNDSDLEERDD